MYYHLIILYFCIYVIWKIWFSKKAGQPPELSGKLPFVGHAHWFFGDGIKMHQTLIKISEECMKKGGVITLNLGFRKMYVITDPEDSVTVSNALIAKEELYQIAKPFLGNGLLTSNNVQTWKKHRKLLSPAMSQPVLNSFVGIFNNQARRLVERFAPELGKTFDHQTLLRLTNLETICLTSTGIGNEEYSNLQGLYLSLVPKILHVFTERLKKFWLHSDLFYNMSKLKKTQDELITPMTELSNTIIQSKKAEMKNYEKYPEENKLGKPKPFMELILDLANETGCFSDQEIIDETNTMIVGGHDTSASVLTILFTLLGTYTDTQSKVYNEILEVLGNEDKDLDKGDLAKLIYTEAVIKETLRLYPIAPMTSRNADKAVKLKNYTVEANTGCVLIIYGLNRHPVWGPDADQFRPERWLDTASLPDPNYFGGFGLGRRSCIGKIYAFMSLKIVIAHTLRRYRISADITKMVLKWNAVARPNSGHEVTLDLR